jgi:hypothetical protein
MLVAVFTWALVTRGWSAERCPPPQNSMDAPHPPVEVSWPQRDVRLAGRGVHAPKSGASARFRHSRAVKTLTSVNGREEGEKRVTHRTRVRRTGPTRRWSGCSHPGPSGTTATGFRHWRERPACRRKSAEQAGCGRAEPMVYAMGRIVDRAAEFLGAGFGNCGRCGLRGSLGKNRDPTGFSDSCGFPYD